MLISEFLFSCFISYYYCIKICITVISKVEMEASTQVFAGVYFSNLTLITLLYTKFLERRIPMDESIEREIRLQQLAQKIVSGDITEGERQEYDSLRNEQSTQQESAIATLAEKHVKLQFPKFSLRRRKS